MRGRRARDPDTGSPPPTGPTRSTRKIPDATGPPSPRPAFRAGPGVCLLRGLMATGVGPQTAGPYVTSPTSLPAWSGAFAFFCHPAAPGLKGTATVTTIVLVSFPEGKGLF